MPPEAAVHHLIVFPAEVALSCAVPPTHMLVAVTDVGAEGMGFTVTTLLADAVQFCALVTVTV